MKKSVSIKYDFGTEVLLKTDPLNVRIVTSILLRPDAVKYGLMKGDEETWHSNIEIEELPVSRKTFQVKGFHG